MANESTAPTPARPVTPEERYPRGGSYHGVLTPQHR